MGLIPVVLTATSSLIKRLDRDGRRVALQARAGGVRADLPAEDGPSGVHPGGAEWAGGVEGGAAVTLSPAGGEGKHTVTTLRHSH